MRRTPSRRPSCFTCRLTAFLSAGRAHSPARAAVLAASLLPICFAAGLLAGRMLAAGADLTLLYGAGNGLVTIERGTAPLVLFDRAAYGALVGRLLAPSFFLALLLRAIGATAGAKPAR